MSTSEKDRVYAELDRLRTEAHSLRKRVAEQRKAISALSKNSTAKESAALRAEASAYRSALSRILYLLNRGDLDDELLRHIVDRALLLRGLKISKRDRIEKAHAKDAA